MRVFRIEAIFSLRNIPPVSFFDDEAKIIFSFWKTVRMRLFSFVLGVSVGGGLMLR